MKSLAILGSTGSIGVSTLEIVAAHPERFRVVALTAGRNLALLEQQIRTFCPELVAVPAAADAERLAILLGTSAPRILSGRDGLVACAADSGAQIVVSAIVGAAGLEPTLAAIEAGIDVALANKETLVAAGEVVMSAVARHGIHLFPVDSEHSAIFQSLAGHRKDDVRRLILTASGGPFRDRTAAELELVTPAAALAHPTWNMGQKITIDSATLMNKGLEVIEAHWLFDLPPGKIAVHVHPESIVHSMVEYVDGSVIAQLGIPDMKTPIALALSWPERLALDLPPLDLCRLGRLHFHEPDNTRFPCLALAYRALRSGGTAPAALNAANEEAVAAFLDHRLGFSAIPRVIAAVLDRQAAVPADTLAAVLAADTEARQTARHLIATEFGGNR
jgi:1-deoxy-D-xylulose-5-phosphate reductoisomerase